MRYLYFSSIPDVDIAKAFVYAWDMENTEQGTVTLKSRKDIGSYASTHEFVMFVDGVAVSYIKLMTKAEYAGWASLCTIETRPDFQGQGYAKALLAKAGEALNLEVGTTGGYTPEGFVAFSGKLPRILEIPEPKKPTFESMTFIEDWENLHRFS